MVRTGAGQTLPAHWSAGTSTDQACTTLSWIYPGTPSLPHSAGLEAWGTDGGPQALPHTPFRGTSDGPAVSPAVGTPAPNQGGRHMATPSASWSAGSSPTALRGQLSPTLQTKSSPGWGGDPAQATCGPTGPWTLRVQGPQSGSTAGRRLEIKLRCVGPAASWVDSPLLKAHLQPAL